MYAIDGRAERQTERATSIKAYELAHRQMYRNIQSRIHGGLDDLERRDRVDTNGRVVSKFVHFLFDVSNRRLG